MQPNSPVFELSLLRSALAFNSWEPPVALIKQTAPVTPSKTIALQWEHDDG